MTGLRDRLMAPEAAEQAMRAYAEETNRLNRERRASGARDRKAQTARTCTPGHLEARNANAPAVPHLEMDDDAPWREPEPGQPRHTLSFMLALAL